MSKTSTKEQTSTPANAAVSNAYTGLVNNAVNTASQPLSLYNGPLVAGLTDTQNQAISGIGAAANGAAPGLAQAQQFINQSATPITPQAYSADAINQYMNPYINDVVGATQRQFNLQNAQQQSALRGSSAASGALGGDREAILQSQLAGQQASAQDPILAGLYSNGFNAAQGEFNTQQGVGLSAAQANNASAANAGAMTAANAVAGQNSALTGNQALLSAGAQQQQINQENLDVPYEQYLQQQAYPYQNEDFLASILGGAAQGSGTTTTGSSTTPFNPLSIVGLGSPYARGGRTGLAAGGVPDVSVGYVPSTAPGMGGGIGGANLSDGPHYQGKSTNLFAGDGSGSGTASGASSPVSGIADAASGALAFLGLARGGRTKLADGGNSDNEDYLQEVLTDLGAGKSPADATPPGLAGAAAPSAPAGASLMTADDTPPAWRGQATNFAVPAAPPNPSTGTAGLAGAAAPTWDDGTPVASGIAAAASPATPGTKGYDVPANSPDIWHSVIAGLGGLLSKGNIGSGIQAGLADWDSQKDPHPTVDHSGATVTVMSRGADGSAHSFDIGIPTEAAINAKAMNDYRLTNMDTVNTTRKDAIAERAQAAQDAVAQRTAAERDAAANRAAMLQVAQINAQSNAAGRYGQPVSGQGVDPATGKTVPGVYVTNTKSGQPEFHPGIVLTPTASLRSIPAMVASKWMAENPNATAQEAENFATDFTARNAGERTLGTTQARIGLGSAEMEQLIPLVKQASANLPRSQFPTANSVVQAFQNGSGDPRVRDLAVKLQGLQSAYSQLLTRGGVPTDSARAAADHLFSTADTDTVLGTVTAAMTQEAAAVRAAPGMVRHDLQNGYSATVSNGPSPGFVSKGHRFKGGNPADPKNWEPVQ